MRIPCIGFGVAQLSTYELTAPLSGRMTMTSVSQTALRRRVPDLSGAMAISIRAAAPSPSVSVRVRGRTAMITRSTAANPVRRGAALPDGASAFDTGLSVWHRETAAHPVAEP